MKWIHVSHHYSGPDFGFPHGDARLDLSACFESAMEFAARNMKITLPADQAVDAEIDLCPEGGAFSFAARLYVNLPGMERATVQRLVEALRPRYATAPTAELRRVP